MRIQDLFKLGMKRDINELIEPVLNGPDSVAINLGCGNSHIEGTTGLDYPEWDGSYMAIPYEDGDVDTIFAFHFLEHLTSAQVINMLREFQRVLKVGGTANIVVPYYKANIAFQDLDHKSFFTEETFKTLFRNPYYDKNREMPWKLDIHANFVLGIVERNMALHAQLVRVE